MGLPARGYSWPPFQPGQSGNPERQFTPGNLASARHGVWSRRKVEPVCRELVVALLEDRPDLAAYPEALQAWARAEARCILFSDHLADLSLVDNKGEPVPSLKYVAQFERLAIELRGRLGLDPKSEAELARGRTDAAAGMFDLDRVLTAGREAWARRDETSAAASGDEDGDAGSGDRNGRGKPLPAEPTES